MEGVLQGIVSGEVSGAEAADKMKLLRLKWMAHEREPIAMNGDPIDVLFLCAARSLYTNDSRIEEVRKSEMRILEHAWTRAIKARDADKQLIRADTGRYARTEAARAKIRKKAKAEEGGGEWRELAIELADAMDGLPSHTALSPQALYMASLEAERSKHG